MQFKRRLAINLETIRDTNDLDRRDGLGIFLVLPDVELPHYFVKTLLHRVNYECGIVKIGDQDV